MRHILDELKAHVEPFRGEWLTKEPIARHTSFKIGGPAEVIAIPADLGELKRLYHAARAYGVQVYIIGQGTNLLAPDENLPGVVIKTTNALTHKEFDGTRVRVGAGYSLSRLALDAARLGLSGLEFACGLPGTVGGGVAMNAGAWGKCIADILEWVIVLTRDCQELKLRATDLTLSYRNSRILSESLVVTEAQLALKPSSPAKVWKTMRAMLDKRRQTQPLGYPSAGSVFKNPAPNCTAGWLIESAGLKGVRCGDAMISEVHANFIVNVGRATACDVVELMRKARNCVKQKFDIQLEPEIRLLGNLAL